MIFACRGKKPVIDSSCFVAPDAVIVGDVEIGAHSSVWFGGVIRGDIYPIKIGSYTNIQDKMIIHVTKDKYSTTIGDYVTGGHGAIVHGCTISDNCIIGMGSIVLDDTVIGKNCIVAAGSVVKQHERIPDGVMVAGNPAVIKRDLTEREIANIKTLAINYSEYIKGYEL